MEINAHCIVEAAAGEFLRSIQRDMSWAMEWAAMGWDFRGIKLTNNYNGGRTLEPGTQLEFDFMKEISCEVWSGVV